MKNALLITLSLFLTFSCGNSSQKQEIAVDESNEQLVIDTNTVYVYYFHGKQRCKTCMAVEKVAKEVIDTSFAAKPNVKFLVLLTED